HDTTNHPRRVDVTSDLASGIDAFEPCALECSAMLPEIPPRDSVLHGHNAGRSIIEVMEVARDWGDLMRLDREQDAVLWACVGHCLHGFYILGVQLVAVFLDEREPILPEGSEVRPARNQRDVLAGEGRLCAAAAAS